MFRWIHPLKIFLSIYGTVKKSMKFTFLNSMKTSNSLTFVFGLTAVEKPNFVLIYVDDLGWTDSSVEMVQGDENTRSDFYQTPFLAKLAQEGMVFSNAYAPAPVCTPSRNSMLHGMTPAKMLNSVLFADESIKNYRGEITIPQALKKQIKTIYPLTLVSGTFHVSLLRKPALK